MKTPPHKTKNKSIMVWVHRENNTCIPGFYSFEFGKWYKADGKNEIYDMIKWEY